MSRIGCGWGGAEGARSRQGFYQPASWAPGCPLAALLVQGRGGGEGLAAVSGALGSLLLW